MAGIFISYRRDDSASAAGRIFDHLSSRFGREQVFMDVDGIEPGLDFIDVLNARVSGCDVLAAVIGRNWLTTLDGKGRRRIDLDTDFVHIELAAALERNVRLIPILVDGADMPSADDLPDRLKPLARRNAFEVSHGRFATEMQMLSDTLAKIVATASESAPAALQHPAAGGSVPAGAIADALRPMHNGTNIFIAPGIPPDREFNARAACQIPVDETSIALIDCTVLGNGRDALVLTNRALYAHHSQETPRLQSIPLDALRDAQLYKRGWWHIGAGSMALCTSGGPGPETVIALLNIVQDALKKA